MDGLEKLLCSVRKLWDDPKLRASCVAGVAVTVLLAIAQAAGLPLTITEAGAVTVVAMLAARWRQTSPPSPSATRRGTPTSPSAVTGIASPAFRALAVATGNPPRPLTEPPSSTVRVLLPSGDPEPAQPQPPPLQ